MSEFICPHASDKNIFNKMLILYGSVYALTNIVFVKREIILTVNYLILPIIMYTNQ